MRPKIDAQSVLEFPFSHLALTQAYYAKYKSISKLLDQTPELVALAHGDLAHALEQIAGPKPNPRFCYTSDNVLRVLLVQLLEGFSLREAVVRVDDSPALRQFTRLEHKPMMDFTTLCKLKNAIRPATWKRINQRLAEQAVRFARVTGEALRLDTTAVETNIHWPTDSTLLWDGYRLLARQIEQARKFDPDLVGPGRLHQRRAKREALAITRQAARKGQDARALKPLYRRLLGRVEAVCAWALRITQGLHQQIACGRYPAWESALAKALVREITRTRGLVLRVVDQAKRRVLQAESVPNHQKLFSLFEPHTELLKRGKAGKEIEFGHMIQIQQVPGKFITDYVVFAHKPAEHTLLSPALASHRALFGSLPVQLTADKGYYESMEKIRALERNIPVVSIAKKGMRTSQETARESDPLFRHAQAFRAGVEGTISFLKRVLRLGRCFNKGWEHFVATVGMTIFAHNLLVLARD